MNNWPKPTSFDIIRSLDKRLREYRHVGWVYIMRNPAFRELLLKIGQSSRPPMLRALDLSSATAVPQDFEIIYFVHVADRHQAEQYVHAELGSYRASPGKEFFSAPLVEAIEALDRAAASLPITVGRGKYAHILEQYFGAVTATCTGCGTKNRVRELAITVAAKCRSCGKPLSPNRAG
jgi:hypothetical protein